MLIVVLLLTLTCLSTAAPLSSGLLKTNVKEATASCGTEMAKVREKRWSLLRNTYGKPWPKNRPITISVLNSPPGFTVGDVEDVAVECARVSTKPVNRTDNSNQ